MHLYRCKIIIVNVSWARVGQLGTVHLDAAVQVSSDFASLSKLVQEMGRRKGVEGDEDLVDMCLRST